MAQRRKVQAVGKRKTLERLENAVQAFAHRREWEQFHDPKNLTMALASEVGELTALLRWVPNQEADRAAAEAEMAISLRQEIGDVGILLLLLCHRLGVRLDDAVSEKLRINEARYPVATSRGRSARPNASPKKSR